MSAQNFLKNQVGRLRRVVAGDDYLGSNSTPGKNYTEFKRDQANRRVQTPNGLSSLNRPGELNPRQSRFTPEIPKPKNPNASARSRARTPVIKPNPLSAPATGRLTGSSMPSARGGILTGLAGVAASQLVEPMSREIVRGARMLLGDENYKLPPYIKSVDGANYDIRADSGKDAYLKANSSGLSEMDQRALALKNEEGIARIKAESDKVIKAGQDDIDSVFYKTPTREIAAPNGGDGNGTQTSPGGVPILDAAGAASFLNNLQVGTGQFSSTQLPMTQSSMWEKGSVDAQAFSGLEPSYTSNTLGSYTASPKAFANLDATGTGSEFNPNASVIPDAALRIGQATGAIPTASPMSSGRLADALNDQAGMQSYMSKFGDADADMQRRANAAFLNTGGSMKGLRAKEAELGMFYAGGQHLSLNGDGSEFLRNKDGKNIAADPNDVRNYKSGKMTAEQFRDTFKGAVNQTFTTAKDSESSHSKNPVAASYQSPNTNFGPVMDTEEMGKRLDASIGMNGTFGPVNDGDVYGSFLDGRREPSMRGIDTGRTSLPIAVDIDNIPDDLYSPAGQKYLADLQAGKLTRSNPYSR